MTMADCQTVVSLRAIYAWVVLVCALGCATPWAKEVRKVSEAEGRFGSQDRVAGDADEILVSDRATGGKLAKADYGSQTIDTLLEATEPTNVRSYANVSTTENASSLAAVPTPTIAEAQALDATLSELQEMGAIDAATHTQLLDSLQHTDPALWPQLLAYFRSAASQRKQPLAEPPVEPVQLASATKPSADVAVVKEKNVPEQVNQGAIEPAAKPEEPPPSAENEKKESADKEEAPRAAAKKGKKTKRRKTASPKKEATSEDWQQVLAASIERLEKQTTQPPSTSAEVSQHAALRMMYLAAGRREDALKPIEGIPPGQQDFWAKELYGLSAYLDPTRNPDAGRRAAEANQHFREASARLSEIATLQVRNLSFCKEVTSYGVYKTFDVAQFHAGQELLLYAEVENFKSEHQDRGYHTALKASYQILDERGHRVDEKEFAITEEFCQNPRRDFFVRYFIWMPQRIYGGKYTLQLTVEDTLSQKIGQSSVEFSVATSGDAAP